MNGTQVSKNKDRQYRVILFVVIGLAAISSATKDLGQLRDIGMEVAGLVAEWSNALTPSVSARTPMTITSCSAGNLVQNTDEFNWSGVVAPGLAVEIKGVNGDITAESASTNEVQVTATKKSRRSDVNSVQIKVVPHAGGVTICALYPDEDGTTGSCEPGSRSRNTDSGNRHVRNNDVKVDFVVRVPQQVAFIGRTVNGGISAGSLSGNVITHTVNGSIKISTSGYAEAKTVNGGIFAKLGSATWPNSLEFTSVNGEIVLELPAGVSTEVEAQTLNGSISSDFPLNVTSMKDLKHLKGIIGGGGRQLLLKTLNGSINLRLAS